jgi:glyceraldehyde-3-phosphate dehydrogenase/erythrose-4-phosphate dehydrogenase
MTITTGKTATKGAPPAGGTPRAPRAGHRAGSAPTLHSKALRAALVKFAGCMRAHGIKVPTPNVSGTGPVFDPKGIDTSSAQFRAAAKACRSTLASAFPGAPGG